MGRKHYGHQVSGIAVAYGDVEKDVIAHQHIRICFSFFLFVWLYTFSPVPASLIVARRLTAALVLMIPT